MEWLKWSNQSRLGLLVMAKDPLADAGLHFDELNKLRVLDPDVSQKTTELKEECKDFVDSKFIPVSSDTHSELSRYLRAVTFLFFLVSLSQCHYTHLLCALLSLWKIFFLTVSLLFLCLTFSTASESEAFCLLLFPDTIYVFLLFLWEKKESCFWLIYKSYYCNRF